MTARACRERMQGVSGTINLNATATSDFSAIVVMIADAEFKSLSTVDPTVRFNEKIELVDKRVRKSPGLWG